MCGTPSTNARQQFLRKLNKKRFTHVSAANCRFEMELGEETSEPPSPWEASFLNVSNEVASLEPLALPSVWVERLARWADHVGWLSGSGISSTLYQLKEAMGSALESWPVWTWCFQR